MSTDLEQRLKEFPRLWKEFKRGLDLYIQGEAQPDEHALYRQLRGLDDLLLKEMELTDKVPDRIIRLAARIQGARGGRSKSPAKIAAGKQNIRKATEARLDGRTEEEAKELKRMRDTHGNP